VFIIEDEDPWAAVPALLSPSTKCVVNGVDITTSMTSIFTKNTLSRWLEDNVLNAYGHAYACERRVPGTAPSGR